MSAERQSTATTKYRDTYSRAGLRFGWDSLPRRILPFYIHPQCRNFSHGSVSADIAITMRCIPRHEPIYNPFHVFPLPPPFLTFLILRRRLRAADVLRHQ